MKKIIRAVAVLLTASMLLSGCVMRTVDELYCLPNRAQADDDLQKVIEQAMSGMAYSAPVYGENRQVLQSADLDGDGTDEYVALAWAAGQKTLKLLIFRQLALGYVLSDTIDGYGSAYDFITFANVDEYPGAEIIVGRQVGDGVVRSAAVYRFDDGRAEQIAEMSYTEFLTADLDGDGRNELLTVRSGEDGSNRSDVSLYRYEGGNIVCADTLELHSPAENLYDLSVAALRGDCRAVLATFNDGGVQTMELFTLQGGALSYLYGPVSVEMVNGNFILPADADGDGHLELPELIPIYDADGTETGEYWIVWYGVNGQGQRNEGMYTYYNYGDKWYLHIDRTWSNALTVTQNDTSCTFTNADKEMVMSIYALTGTNRKEQARTMGGVILGSSDTVIFVALTGPGAEKLGITENLLKQLFYPVELNLYTEE